MYKIYRILFLVSLFPDETVKNYFHQSRNAFLFHIDPNVAKVEDAADPRRQG